MPDPHSDKIPVMLVEDDDVFREALQEMINCSEGFVCQYAWENAEDCLAFLQKGDAPALILLDIDLPGMDGISAISHIRMLTPATQVVMLTVFDDDDKVFNAICQGAVGYLLKSVEMGELQANLKAVIAGGAAMSPHVAAKVLTMFTRYAQPREEYGLTGREKEVLLHLVNGLSKKHIADQLNISFYTVDTHLKNIYSKLRVHSQVDVVAKAIRERLI